MTVEVYAITSPSGKRYVGITSRGFARRWVQHVADAKKGSSLRFHQAIRKYGPEAFTHELLERTTTVAGAKRAEQLWIRELGTFGQGYNATAGGDGLAGLAHGDASRAKMAAAARARGVAAYATALARAHTPEGRARSGEARRGVRLTPEHCANLSRAHTGSTQSESTRDKLSAALRGRKRPPEVCAKISATKRRNRS